MKIHEYQARDLLHHAGAPVPPGAMVETVDEAVAETERILGSGAGLVVIKAQVHAGGRGKQPAARRQPGAAPAVALAGRRRRNVGRRDATR